MSDYRVLIVEDDEEAHDALASALARYGSLHGVSFAHDWLRSPIGMDPTSDVHDLIFMDIDMPGMTGMEAAEELREHDQATPLIFVTNLAAYAVHGYAVDALDFIVKPFTYADFSLRMDRAMRVMQRPSMRTLTVKARDGVRIFSAESLISVESARHDITYRLTNGDSFSLRGSLRAVEEELGGSPFLKLSASCIVNMSQVRGVNGSEVTLSDGSRAWISRANRRRCLEAIASHLGGSI